MIREALDYLAKLQTPKNPTTVTVHDLPFAAKANRTLGEFAKKPDASYHPETPDVSTLSAIVAAYKAAIDKLDPAAVVVHVIDPFIVATIARAANDFGYRHVYARAEYTSETPFKFGVYHPPEDFLINFRASFYFNDEAAKVQQLCSSLEAGSTVSISDDGISQTVVATSGTINKAAVTLPAEGIPLVPWRTFREANPVESKFLLRMKTVKDTGPRVALFEIDEKWQIETSEAVAAYLKANLPPDAVIVV